MTMKKVPPPRLPAASLRSVSVLHVLPGGLERPLAVLQSWILFSRSCISRMRGQVPLPSRKPRFGGIHPYTTEGAPGLYVRLTDSSAVRGPFRGISNADSITPPHTEA